MNRLKSKKFISNVLQTVIIYILTTLLAYVLNLYDMQSDSLKMLFLLGVLIVILQTQSFFLTLLASLAFTFTDAWLFIDPSQFHRRSFILSNIFFVAIALIVNVLANRLQKQMERSKENEKLHRRLYEASEGLIQVQGRENIISYADKALTKLAGAKVELWFDVPRDETDEAKKWCFLNSAPCGHGEADFTDEPKKYIPIRSNRKTIGVLAVDCSEKELSHTVEDCIVSFTSQISIAIAREEVEERSKKESAMFAREKIKGTVMKRLSHDMYPRIAEIHKISEYLLSTGSTVPHDAEDKLKTIERESSFLTDTVDNILDITSR